jgi:hypothetical protein
MKLSKCAGLIAAVMLLVMAGAAQAAEPPKAPPKGPQGWGVFLHLQFAARGGGVPASLMDHPLVDGARYSLNWAELEPREGQYNWDIIEKLASEWAARGKHVVIAVKTAQKGGHSPTSKSATPDWVFAAGAKKVMFTVKGGESNGEQTVYPVFWDPVYLAKYEKFIKALATRFDGDPRIEYFEIGVGQGGATKVTPDKGGFAAFETTAEPPYTPERFVGAAKKILDAEHATFKKTPTAVFLNTFFRQKDGTEQKHMPEIARYAADRGIYLFSRSLDERVRAMVERGYVQVFAELAPKTKIAFAYDFNIVKDPGKKPHPYEQSVTDFTAAMHNAVGGFSVTQAEQQQALAAAGGEDKKAQRQAKREARRGNKEESGGANGTLTIPTTQVSYLFLLERDASLMDPKRPAKGALAYDKRIEEEVRKVREQLRKTLPGR